MPSGPLTTVEGSPWSARHAGATPTCVGRPSAVLPVFEAVPAARQLFPGRPGSMGGVQLLLQPSHFRLEPCTFALRGLRSAGFHRVCSGSGLEATPHAAPCAPSDGSCADPRGEAAGRAGAALCLLQIRSRYCAVNLRLRLGHDLRVRRWPRVAGSGPGGLVRRSSTPRAGASISCNVIDSLSAACGLHRPTVIPSGAGVSVRLAERTGLGPFFCMGKKRRRAPGADRHLFLVRLNLARDGRSGLG